MTDKELLELAAKAAKIDWFRNTVSGLWNKEGDIWNPLTDDGDALRLAVKLGISPVFLYSKLESSFERGISARHMEIDCEQWGDDLNAATRRAITRAAAEIGKTK
jgi:hypothetical protein